VIQDADADEVAARRGELNRKESLSVSRCGKLADCQEEKDRPNRTVIVEGDSAAAAPRGSEP